MAKKSKNTLGKAPAPDTNIDINISRRSLWWFSFSVMGLAALWLVSLTSLGVVLAVLFLLLGNEMNQLAVRDK